MPKPLEDAPRAPAHYTTATERTFRSALATLEKTLPEHHGALAALLDAGRVHEIDAIRAVLEGRCP